MFIDDSNLIEIKIYYRKTKTSYVSISQKEHKKLKDTEKAKYKEFNIKMKPLTWDLYNLLQDEAQVENMEGDKEFSYRSYKENKLIKLIASWDAKDKEDKVVPINEKNIKSLAPNIAETILREYDEVSFLGEEEENF